MYNYRLINQSGKTLGVIILETEELATLAAEGETMILSASMVALDEGKKKLLEFIVAPEMVRPTPRPDRF